MASAAEVALVFAIVTTGVIVGVRGGREGLDEALHPPRSSSRRILGDIDPARRQEGVPQVNQGAETDLQALERMANGLARTRLSSLPLEYNRPQTLPFNENSEFAVVLAGADLGRAQHDIARYAGDKKSVQVAVSNRVAARLTGAPDQVKIALRGEEWRDVSSVVNTKWIWDVQPLKPGRTTLTLTVATQVPIRGRTSVDEFEVFRDEIEVTMPFGARALFFSQKYQSLLAALGITGASLAFGIWRVIVWVLPRKRETEIVRKL